MGGYAEETQKAMDLTQQEREAQKSVMQMITEPKAETLTKDEIRDRLQGAEWLDKAEQEKIKGLTGKSTEIAIDGEAAEIVGFGAKNVEEEIDGEKKKYSVATVKLADGREVEISAVDAMNKGVAQVLKFMQAEAGKSVGSNLGVTLLDVAAKAKDTAQAVTDAVNVMWSEALGIGTGKTNLDTKTEQRIREAVKKDIDAGAAARAKMMKEIRPGQGKVTLEGAAAGTKEYNTELAKLGKNIRVEAEFIAGMMKSLGMDVQMYWNPEESAKQGVYYGGEDGGIRVNLAGTYDTKGTHRSAVATVAHEGTHWLAANAPKAYQQMRSFTITNLAKNGVNVKAELRRIMDNYERHGESLDLNGAIDEMVAMGYEQVLTNEKLAAKLKTQDPETHGKLRQAVKWVVDKIREVIGSVRTTSSKYARSLMNVADEAARIWGIAYEEATGATETGTGTEERNSRRMDVEEDTKKGTLRAGAGVQAPTITSETNGTSLSSGNSLTKTGNNVKSKKII
ncbi:MAG: hypothetical protein IJ926_00315, partial [Firmicutes bacterium]|nr:hypothetical protein [Bacillota bacterium]